MRAQSLPPPARANPRARRATLPDDSSARTRGTQSATSMAIASRGVLAHQGVGFARPRDASLGIENAVAVHLADRDEAVEVDAGGSGDARRFSLT